MAKTKTISIPTVPISDEALEALAAWANAELAVRHRIKRIAETTPRGWRQAELLLNAMSTADIHGCSYEEAEAALGSFLAARTDGVSQGEIAAFLENVGDASNISAQADVDDEDDEFIGEENAIRARIKARWAWFKRRCKYRR